MKYQLIVLKRAQKDLKKLDPRYKTRVLVALVAIRQDPFSGKALEGEYKGVWSYRVWPYRILYQIRQNQLLIQVIKIGHRQGGY